MEKSSKIPWYARVRGCTGAVPGGSISSGDMGSPIAGQSCDQGLPRPSAPYCPGGLHPLVELGVCPQPGALKNVDDILFKFITPPLDEAHMRPSCSSTWHKASQVRRRSSRAAIFRCLHGKDHCRGRPIPGQRDRRYRLPPHAYPSAGDAALRTRSRNSKSRSSRCYLARPPDGERRPLLVPTYPDDLAPDHIQFASFVLTGDKVGRYWGAVRGSDGTLLPSVLTLLTWPSFFPASRINRCAPRAYRSSPMRALRG